MNKIFISLCIATTLYQLLTSCANVTPPSGGPRDTISPIRLLTIPLDKSINYNGKTIVMEYDERINVIKIKEQLIITPHIESDYEYTIKKNVIKLNFEEAFEDSTTYTLNFRESIQDITEKNPTKDNKFTFSTGSFIDSMSINGYVKDLLTFDTLENIVVGIYNANDTVTIFNGSPYYFTEVDEEGYYEIENIKIGQYLLYAFRDDNKNLTLESNNETYGFKKDTLNLMSDIITNTIDLVSLDLTDLKYMTALASGKYFDINFNKYLVNYSVTPLQKDKQVITNIAKKNKSIRFYNNITENDSIQISFTAYDSIDNSVSDTLFVKFIQSKRKTEKFKIEVFPKSKKAIETKINLKIDFNKPIISVNTDSIFVQFDTTKILAIHDSIFKWNNQKDLLTFSIDIDKSKADTILNRRIKLNQLKRDSVSTTQKETKVKQQISKKKKEEKKLNQGLQLYFGNGSFISADLDTSKTMSYNYNFIVPQENGIQIINIETSYINYIVQLVTQDFQIIKESKNEKSIIFNNIAPDKYKLRVLIDANNDGKWSQGNMKKQIEPEPVYIYPELLIIRADWQTSLDITF